VVAVALLSAVTAGAGPRARTASLAGLAPGDRFHVTGTPVVCAVDSSRAATSVVCALRSIRSPTPGSYRVAISDAHVLLAAVKSRSPKVVRQITEPATRGAVFGSPAGAPEAYKLTVGENVEIGGSHILCEVRDVHGFGIYVICGLAVTTTIGTATEITFPAGSYLIAVSTRFADLEKVEPDNRVTSVAYESQP